MAQAHPMSDFGRHFARRPNTSARYCAISSLSRQRCFCFTFVLVFVMHFSHCQLLSWTGRGASVLSEPQMR